MEFKAKEVNGEIVVDAVVEKIGNDVIVHVPSFPLINKVAKEFKEKKK